MSQGPTPFLGQPYAWVESVECPSELDTLRLAQRWASLFLPGDRIALTGDLGAGKTTWVRGLAETLNLQDSVHSPTYALIHSYGEPPKLHHLDLYRLAPGTDWNELGLEDIFDSDAIACIEWPERMPQGTRFQHWIDIQFRALSEKKTPVGPDRMASDSLADSRVVHWYRLMESR